MGISTTAGSACINAKERQMRRTTKRKGIEATDAALIGEEEQKGKQKKKKETGSGPATQLLWTI